MNITLRQVQAFLALADLGSFTRAAERMRVAQPALSQQIRDLELELGVRLFDRTTRRVEMTAAGEEFRLSAAKIVEELELAVGHARDLAERRRGRLVVAAPPLLAAAMLPEAIAAFARQHPGVRVELHDLRTDEIVARVRDGRADCGIGTFPPDEDGIERLVLARDSLMVYGPADCDLAAEAQVPWRTLAGRPLVALTRDSGLRLLAEVGFETARVVMRPAYEVAQITTAMALVEAGLGIAVLPTYAGAVARPGRVMERPLVEPNVAREIVMISRQGRSAPPALASFAQVLRRHSGVFMAR